MLLKHFPFSEMSFFGDVIALSSAKFDVSLFSFESISISQHEDKSDVDFVVAIAVVSVFVSIDIDSLGSTSAIFSKFSLSAQS